MASSSSEALVSPNTHPNTPPPNTPLVRPPPPYYWAVSGEVLPPELLEGTWEDDKFIYEVASSSLRETDGIFSYFDVKKIWKNNSGQTRVTERLFFVDDANILRWCGQRRTFDGALSMTGSTLTWTSCDGGSTSTFEWKKIRGILDC